MICCPTECTIFVSVVFQPRQIASQKYEISSFNTCSQWNITYCWFRCCNNTVICNLKKSFLTLTTWMSCSFQNIELTRFQILPSCNHYFRKSCMEIRFMCHQICDQGLPWEIRRHQICQQANIEKKKTQATVPLNPITITDSWFSRKSTRFCWSLV